MHPVTSVYCRASETLAHLPPSQSSGLFIFYHLLFPMLSSTAFLWLPTSFAHDSNPSYCPPFFSLFIFFPLSFHLSSIFCPVSSVPAGYSPDLAFHFPPLSHSYPLFLTLACSPWFTFCPLAFITPFPFIFFAFSTLHFHSVLPWGFQGGLKGAEGRKHL